MTGSPGPAQRAIGAPLRVGLPQCPTRHTTLPGSLASLHSVRRTRSEGARVHELASRVRQIEKSTRVAGRRRASTWTWRTRARARGAVWLVDDAVAEDREIGIGGYTRDGVLREVLPPASTHAMRLSDPTQA